MRIVLGIEYDGGGFCGWQSQADGGGVQDAVEAALAKIAAKPLRLTCAGRTDAGVHALAQAAHFDVDCARPASAWVRGVNSFLPAAVAVRWAQQVDAAFHARFSATGRSYRYLLLNRPQRPALLAGRVGWCWRPLDVGLMQEAAASLVGEHDFSSFRASGCQAKSPLKTLRRFELRRHGDLIIFDCSASAFLHHMVRNMVGALVQVGLGQRPPQWMAELLAARDRRLGAPTFAPQGLYLSGVDYPAHWGLPDEAGMIAVSPLPIF